MAGQLDEPDRAVKTRMRTRTVSLVLVVILSVQPAAQGSTCGTTLAQVQCENNEAGVPMFVYPNTADPFAGVSQGTQCMKCVPVKCDLQPVAALLGTHGALSATPLYTDPNSGDFVVVGTEVTIQCNLNYGITTIASDTVVPSGAESSASWVCGEDGRQSQGPPTCTSPTYYCRLKVCGDYIVPGKGATAVVRSSHGTSREFHSNEIIKDVAFGDTIAVNCTTANQLIGAASCSDKQLAPFIVTCQDAQMAFANWQIDICEPCDVCGNDIFESRSEECDDGNEVGGDGCSSTCKIEVCGNRVIDVGEDCDDGTVGEGCNDMCHFEECGNGVKDVGEGCDDGNNNTCDGCSSCTIDVCGDGLVCALQKEACDDGICACLNLCMRVRARVCRCAQFET